MMERSSAATKNYSRHVLVVPYTTQGHINPMHQFAKRLASKGLKVTFAPSHFVSKSLPPHLISASSCGPVKVESISDGHDDGGFMQAQSAGAYIARFQAEGSKSLAALIEKHRSSAHPISCMVYDAFMPWALDVARRFGLVAAPFFTQPCAVNYIYYAAHRKLLPLPALSSPVASLPAGLPPLDLPDMPSFLVVAGSYPAHFEMMLNRFSNSDNADCILVNTFYELEAEAMDHMSAFLVCPMLTIGPTIPSLYLDNRLENDSDYDVNLLKLDDPSGCLGWLGTKPKGSVAYVSFGSLSSLKVEQMQELAWALKVIATDSPYSFLWVVRKSEESRLPTRFLKDELPSLGSKGLVVNWSPQLKVLSHDAIGCFLTHCGWNSTTEALSLGVPMVAMPQWTDQPTNAKLVEDIWRVGVRVRVDENGIAREEDIELCVREVLGGKRGKEMKDNARKWSEMAKGAVADGGSSDKNIDQFVRMIN